MNFSSSITRLVTASSVSNSAIRRANGLQVMARKAKGPVWGGSAAGSQSSDLPICLEDAVVSTADPFDVLGASDDEFALREGSAAVERPQTGRVR